jgi:hypothetical protein
VVAVAEPLDADAARLSGGSFLRSSWA